MPEVDPQFFVDAMARAGVSQRQLAKLIGLDHSALSLKLRGLREMKAHEAAEVARLLSVPLTDVLSAAGVQVPGDSTVPLVGFIDGEGEVHLTMDQDKPERIAAPPELAGNAMAVMTKASTGRMHLTDGWVYYFRQPAEVPRDIAGSLAIAKITGGMTVLRFVHRGYKPGTYNMTANSLVPIENARLEWAAPVLWIKPSH